MKKMKVALLYILLLWCLKPTNAYADFWGGDIPLLIEIVANTLQQVTQLSNILGKGQETLDYFREINKGIKDAMNIARTLNTSINPGILSDLNKVEDIMATVQDIYGRVPKTSEARLQQTMDQSVAEAIQNHNEAYRYAEKIDPEAERIKDYAQYVNPQGAGRLSAQALGVLIHVMNQVLRTNGTMLKLQGEQLALANKKEKLSSEQFRIQYDSLSNAFSSLNNNYKLSRPGL